MNLILDIGNSRTKGYVFEDDKIIHRQEATGEERKITEILLNRFPGIHSGIAVSTRNINPGLTSLCRSRLKKFIELGPDTTLPIKNLYKTKETLGYDRIAAAVEAHALYPGKNILIIDAGTALTYDLVTPDGDFAGGNISPGLKMRFRALAAFTDKLPLVSPGSTFPLAGKTTKEAISAGIGLGILAEVDGVIDRFREEYKPLAVIVTGGDTFFFDKKLKNSIFVLPELTALGLNRILKFNV